MAVLNFPADTSQSPYEENGITYVWDGQAWVSDGGESNFLPTSGGNVTGNLTVDGNSGVGGDLTVSGDATVGSLNGGPLAGFRNQIINGDFHVWQRGVGPFNNTASAAYTADRWVVATGANNIQRSDSHPLGFSHSISLPADAVLQQGIELDIIGQNGKFANGSTWTLSIWSTQTPAAQAQFIFRDAVGSGLNQVAASPNATFVDTGETSNGFTRFTATVTLFNEVAETNTCLEIQIYGGTAATEITGVQFELGPVATPFEHRSVGSEWTMCQRYYQRIALRGQLVNLNASSSEFAIPISLAAVMRVGQPDCQSRNGEAKVYYSLGREDTSDGSADGSRNIVTISGASNMGQATMSCSRLGSAATQKFATIGGGNAQSQFNLDAEL